VTRHAPTSGRLPVVMMTAAALAGIGLIWPLLALPVEMRDLTMGNVSVPLMWDHYLSTLALPAAFLAARDRPCAIAVPLRSWAPAKLLPVVMVGATLLPFIARAPEPAPMAAV